MMAGFTVTDSTARGQILSTLLLPIPMLAAMTIGIALGPYRVVSLIWLVVLLAASVYVRRFGPRGFAAGLVMFNGGSSGSSCTPRSGCATSAGSRRWSVSASSPH